MMEAQAEVLDVAIIGGGVSGLYSAWRLLCDPERGKQQIKVFEASQRIGGRLLTLKPPGLHTTCELGGMRVMSRHRLVSKLLKHFGLETVLMPTDRPESIAYLRGRQLRHTDLNNPSLVPYNLRPVEEAALADSLLNHALEKILPNCTRIDHAALQDEVQYATFHGTPLHELGFWNVLARTLSSEAHAFLRDSCGYDCLVSNWNAADAIPFILADFGADATYSRVVKGFERLPQLLKSRIEDAGGEVMMGKSLRSFDLKTTEPGNNVVVLSFADNSIVEAKNLVLAMPRRSLELLRDAQLLRDAHPRGMLDSPQVRGLIESVEPIPLFKLFLCYRYPWWKDVGVRIGRSVTDLPIRQVYYWSAEPNWENTDGNSAILASYDDDVNVTFWEGLRDRKAAHKQLEAKKCYGGAQTPHEHWKDYCASHAMLEEAHRQLVEIHGVKDAPEPYDGAYRDWTEDPYGGGVNFWRIGERSWEVSQRMLMPNPSWPVYVCGEAYSREQGWVEGALQTADCMLTRYFQLPST
jgi:monoamine oxidase